MTQPGRVKLRLVNKREKRRTKREHSLSEAFSRNITRILEDLLENYDKTERPAFQEGKMVNQKKNLGVGAAWNSHDEKKLIFHCSKPWRPAASFLFLLDWKTTNSLFLFSRSRFFPNANATSHITMLSAYPHRNVQQKMHWSFKIRALRTFFTVPVMF